MKLLYPFLQFLRHLGYFGPFAMGILDSSFLVLPFGNDLVVVGMVAGNPRGTAWYVLSAAVGSTLGALLLALVSRKLGEEGIRRLAGNKRYESLKYHLGRHAGVAVAVAGLAPPPFPFTTVIAGTAALKYRLWRLLAINFCARATRFALISILAIRFGDEILLIAKSTPFKWGMSIFITLCGVASVFSIAHWLRRPR
ncbi:MAG TPA: VTT domain-containing protein [Terracidiphilus sp.]|nr:VTT domain-containing protein [Terracidiphilus sp.]